MSVMVRKGRGGGAGGSEKFNEIDAQPHDSYGFNVASLKLYEYQFQHI